MNFLLWAVPFLKILYKNSTSLGYPVIQCQLNCHWGAIIGSLVRCNHSGLHLHH